MSHCQECGYAGQREETPTAGSDTIPVFKCPECGDTAFTGCRCDVPASHQSRFDWVSSDDLQ